MKLEGDPAGIEALKAIRLERPEHLKFLITEARSSTMRTADFQGADGRKWVVRFFPISGNLAVEPRG